MNEEKVLICTKEKATVAENAGYIRLLMDVFGGSLGSIEEVLDNLEHYINESMKNMTERERIVLNNMYGIGGPVKTEDEIAEMLGKPNAVVKMIYQKVIRKLRHPARSRVLRGKQKHLNVSCQYDEIFYIEKYREMLENEILSIVKGNDKKAVYLDKIMKRNNIEIINETGFCMSEDVDVEEMKFTVRTYNCLKRAGINELSQMYDMTEEDFMKIRNLGRKSLDEIIEKMEEYGTSVEGYNTLSVTIDGQKTVYKYLDNDYDRIARSLYRNVLYNDLKGKNIMRAGLSPKLTEMLLLKGYFYMNDIEEDMQQLENQFREFGFDELADELKMLYDRFSLVEKSDEIRICVAPEEVIAFVENNKGDSLEEMKKKARLRETTDIFDFLNDLW